MLIVVVSARTQELGPFLAPLKKIKGCNLVIAPTGSAALEIIRTGAPSFVIIDQGLADFTPLKLVTEIMMLNAMINTAVVTDMSPDEFHEASEGLGILTSIPPHPAESDGKNVAEVFGRFM
jgi:DNA-binding response OmpR family regulator